jgi:hypothetical protein
MEEINYTNIAYIYALIDPRTNQVRYVGKTINPQTRKYQHVSERLIFNHYKSRWILTLHKLGLRPIFKILEICPLSNFEDRETYYISLYKSKALTNSDDSGQGNKNRRRELIENANYKSRIVYQFDLDGNFITEYKSVREAARKLKLDHANISRVCNNIYKHTNGYIFTYDKNQNIYIINKPNAIKKSVVEINEIGEVINKWKSIMDCSRDTGLDSGNISRVCSSILKHIKKRKFKFI